MFRRHVFIFERFRFLFSGFDDFFEAWRNEGLSRGARDLRQPVQGLLQSLRHRAQRHS